MSRAASPIAATLLLLLLAVPAAGDAAAVQGLLGGRVTTSDTPLSAATVYLYTIADARLVKVFTDGEGRFGFSELPAGLYKVVAFKPGFVPSVLLLTRATAAMRQFIELELSAAEPAAFESGDFWELRRQIPPDVLRDLTTVAAAAGDVTTGRAFHADVAAVTGMNVLADGKAAQVTVGSVGFRGEIGRFEVGVSGDYETIVPPGFDPSSSAAGESRILSLRLADHDSTQVGVSGFSRRLAVTDNQQIDPMDIERYQVSWSQRLGSTGRSTVAAQYLAESNYYRQSWLDLVGLPTATQSWNLEAAYSMSPSERSSFETGLRYRARESQFSAADAMSFAGTTLPEESIDTFARGGWRVQPAVMIEYGIYSTLEDGSVSLMPRGGVVLQIGERWQAGGSASQRVYEQEAVRGNDFAPAFFGEAHGNEYVDDANYRVFVARDRGDGQRLEIGATQREIGETVRLFFSEDLLHHLESLYLVPGDRLSEAEVKVTRQIAPTVMASLQSTLAEGGGGLFHGEPGTPAYANEVRYAVTSLDTRFQRTSTGVFVAFHRLEQELRPAGTSAASSVTSPEARFERLQLLLTQDLNVLLDLAADWAVQLDMEVSRGDLTTGSSGDDLRRQVMGGFSVTF